MENIVLDVNNSQEAQPIIKPYVEVSLVDRITYASHQNDVAIIADLLVRNITAEMLEDLELSIECDPPLIGSKIWKIDRLASCGEIHIRDRSVALAGAMLDKLNERVRAQVTLKLRKRDDILYESTHSLIGLARNEWGGATSMPELLAAFVMPNDPAVSELLQNAGEALRTAGYQPKLEGYQSKSRERVWEIISAIWTAISSLRLIYAEPPASFEAEGQKIRTPSEIIKTKLATCLDSSLLFASALEQAGLNPVVAFTQGHAFCGAWLQPQQLPTLITDDCSEIRKFVALKELVLFETTFVANEPPLPFSKAIAEANRSLSEENEKSFIYALDIKRARSRQISPLAVLFENPKTTEGKVAATTTVLSLEAAPPLPSFDFGLEEALLPDTPESRLDNWKRKLLDLTKRNRLLNLKSSRTSIQLKCYAPAQLEDKLAAGKKIGVISLAKLSGEKNQRDNDLFITRTGEDYIKLFCEQALENDEIVSEMSLPDLEAGMVELFRKAKLDQEEGGANTLFLAMGILRWKQNERDSQSYRAPLILLPVKLERPSASSKVKILHHEDAPSFNMTLLEMLRHDFNLRIPQLEGALPEDENGVDVPLIWEIVRKAVREVPGFEVVEEVVLSTFSFSKYLMWKDLSDRTESLKQSKFVRHLIETPREVYKGSATFLCPKDIDEKIDIAELFIPLPADSSQIVAIHASTKEGDMVLEGPPGTGKSQTIANLIAHNLAHGRKVLFVSEKMAALDVVYRRLKERGLGNFCLELHSSKTNKRYVLDQLSRSYNSRGTLTASDWNTEVAHLISVRHELNNLVRALHTPGLSGITPHQAIGRAAKWQELHRCRLDWTGSIEADRIKSPELLAKVEDVAKKLGQFYSELSAEDKIAFAAIEQVNWSHAWQHSLVEASHNLIEAINIVTKISEKFIKAIGLPETSFSRTCILGLRQIAHVISAGSLNNYSSVFFNDFIHVSNSWEVCISLVKEYRDLYAQLSFSSTELDLESVPVERWMLLAESNRNTFKPIRIIKNWRLQAAIRKQLLLPSYPKLMEDLPVLIAMKSKVLKLNELSQLLPSNINWEGLLTDLEKQTDLLSSCRELREGMSRISPDVKSLQTTSSILKKLLVESQELIQPGFLISNLALELVEAVAKFESTLQAFNKTANIVGANLEELSGLLENAGAIIKLQPRINAWCKWKAACKEASMYGLDCVQSALESSVIDSRDSLEAFRTAYCIWLVPRLVDDRQELRTFSATSHQDKIVQFRLLDQKLADMAVDYICARLSGEIAATESKENSQEYGILNRELQKKSRHKPVRQLMSEMSGVLTTLTPCVLMSPLSVAQFLPANQQLFDLVVFDEASQITVWDAIGAIARGKNVVVVGDPKQMPPTSFFDRAASDDEQDESNVDDLESILDEALAASVTRHRLTGHYRSKHESLIAFSNHNYYDGELVTFPSAETKHSAVSFINTSGLYERGNTRTNPLEAKAIVQEIIKRLSVEDSANKSLGVVTLNSEQQRLISNLLDDERRKNPSLEQYFIDGSNEPVFVKNLETVQGDERDVILFGIGYGPNLPGANTMSMNFGPLNRIGGERRLNVAITRARSEIVVFSSFDPSLIDLTRTSAKAVRDLKNYMSFAQRGPVALGDVILSTSLDTYDSDFEEEVAEMLRRRGWVIHTQVGVSKFRIDLGVVHPDDPGKYLAGIECDGATYHSSPSARDRDRVRHSILENLGWKLERVWSTDYWIDPQNVIEKLHVSLQALAAKKTPSILL